MRRGEVWLSALDPTVGSKIQKTRPCVIVSPDELNEHLRTIIIAPLTSGSRAARFRLATTFQNRGGFILLDQLRTVDRARLIRPLGKLDPPTMTAVLSALRDMFED